MSRRPRGSGPEAEWFVSAFDGFYPRLYAHRDEHEARLFIRTLAERFAPAGPVLDLACGEGRFLRALEGEGLSGLGLDLSPALLASARRSAVQGAGRLIRADMRELPLRTSSLSWVLLLFTSFGYFAEEADDRTVLVEVARSLRDGGIMALDFMNAARTVRELIPESTREIDGLLVRETRWVDPAGPFLRKRVEMSPGPGRATSRVIEERVRLYTPGQLGELLEQADLAPVAHWGDYAGSPFSPEASARCIVLGRRRERG